MPRYIYKVNHFFFLIYIFYVHIDFVCVVRRVNTENCMITQILKMRLFTDISHSETALKFLAALPEVYIEHKQNKFFLLFPQQPLLLSLLFNYSSENITVFASSASSGKRLQYTEKGKVHCIYIIVTKTMYTVHFSSIQNTEHLPGPCKWKWREKKHFFPLL